MEKLFSDLVRAGLFLPNKDGVKAFAHLLGQTTMKGKPKLYGHKIVKRKRNKGNIAKYQTVICIKLRTE